MMVVKTIVIAAIFVAGLAGCANPRPDKPASPSAGTGGNWAEVADCPAFIDVSYGQGGMPSVVPDECAVAQNADVVWRGPDGNPTIFAIKFTSATPVWEGERLEAMSTSVGSYQEVKKKMTAKPGTYKYAIKANGKVEDPAIIIR